MYTARNGAVHYAGVIYSIHQYIFVVLIGIWRCCNGNKAFLAQVSVIRTKELSGTLAALLFYGIDCKTYDCM